ncbi:AEC family transporter [Pectinatus frisingensis]|jgi:predicted permease|uniref:AEC family transporter n=1 Tax=Pectinatus frisingensis TaxID=865 RepID=UPI0018C47A59|nr:AEC family transporter [Pectinatus frisingensis]
MLQIIDQMIILILLTLLGFVCFKTGIMNEMSNKYLSKLIISIMCPAIIIDSVVNMQHDESQAAVLWVFGAAIVLYFTLPLLSKLCCFAFGIKAPQAKLYEAMLTFSNVGFMGIPVVQAVYGNKAIFYLSIFIFVYNMVVFTYGTYLVSHGVTEKKFALKDTLNTAVIGSLLGILIYFLHIDLPFTVCKAVGMIGQTTTPLAMIVIGSTLAATSVESIFNIKHLYLMSIVKLLFIPLVIRLLFGLFITDQMILGVSVIVAGMPVASNLVMLRNQYGGDSSLLAKGSFMTTILSVFSIPLVVWFIMLPL